MVAEDAPEGVWLGSTATCRQHSCAGWQRSYSLAPTSLKGSIGLVQHVPCDADLHPPERDLRPVREAELP